MIKIGKYFFLLSRTVSNTGLRTYNDIVNSGAYAQSDYQPKPMSKYIHDLSFLLSLFYRRTN